MGTEVVVKPLVGTDLSRRFLRPSSRGERPVQLALYGVQPALAGRRQIAVVAYADIAGRQYVHAIAPQELNAGKVHDFDGAVIPVVLVLERHAVCIDGFDAPVGDGYSVHIPAKILDNLVGPADGRLAVHDPVLGEKRLPDRLRDAYTFRGGYNCSQVDHPLRRFANQQVGVCSGRDTVKCLWFNLKLLLVTFRVNGLILSRYGGYPSTDSRGPDPRISPGL